MASSVNATQRLNRRPKKVEATEDLLVYGPLAVHTKDQPIFIKEVRRNKTLQRQNLFSKPASIPGFEEENGNPNVVNEAPQLYFTRHIYHEQDQSR